MPGVQHAEVQANGRTEAAPADVCAHKRLISRSVPARCAVLLCVTRRSLQ